MRPSSIRRPSAQGETDARARERASGSRERPRGREKEPGLRASWGNISGNKGMGTSVSMVIPSSGFERVGRENALRARLEPFPRRATSRPRPRRVGTRRGSRNRPSLRRRLYGCTNRRDKVGTLAWIKRERQTRFRSAERRTLR